MDKVLSTMMFGVITLSDGARSAFEIVRLVLMILIILTSLIMVVLVLIQPSADQGGANAVTGGTSSSDTYYSKNKSETRETMYKRLTIVLAGALFLFVVAFFVTLIFTGVTPNA